MDFIPWSFRIWILPIKFAGILILHPNISEFEFYPKILRVFGFYSLNFEGIWILHPKVLEFVGVKSKHSQTLRGKIEISKYHGVKFKKPPNFRG